MDITPRHAETIRAALERPVGGVVPLVEELLRLCKQQRLELDWQAERCLVRSAGGEEVIDRPLRKSAFRAVLARVAALCNEGKPGSVSPYGGEGELPVEGDPAAVFRVSFVNTTEEQRLHVVPAIGA